MRCHRQVLALALAASLAAAPARTPTAARAGGGTALVTASAPSPYAGCAIGGPGTVYANAEVEPWIDVNPTTVGTSRLNLLGAWQQDRWSNGGAHGLVAAYSLNGGKTWGETPLPFSACAPGGLRYERASDPWVSFGPDGTAYTISISFNQSNNDNAVAAATSADGGRTWGNLAVLQADTGTSQYFNDKESITADPAHAGVAYAVWDRLVSPVNNPYAAAHAFAYTGPALFAKTTDGGRTWSRPAVVVSTAQNNQTIGNQIVADPRTGTLYDFFDLIVSTGSNAGGRHGYNVAFVTSTDGGSTWSSPRVVAALETAYVSDPNTGAAIRTGDIIPEPAIDPATGKLYVAWQDARFDGGQYDQIALAGSSDGGATWTAPIRVNTPTGRPAFTPSVRVSAAGVVGVAYYDFRGLTTQTATLPTDYWFTASTDGGATFGNEQHLAGPFDLLSAPYAEGYFTGDYEGLAANGPTFQSFFVQTNSGSATNPTDVVTAAVTP